MENILIYETSSDRRPSKQGSSTSHGWTAPQPRNTAQPCILNRQANAYGYEPLAYRDSVRRSNFATNTSFCNFERQRKPDCHHMKIKSHVIAKLKPVCVQLKLQHAMNTIMTAAGFKVFL